MKRQSNYKKRCHKNVLRINTNNSMDTRTMRNTIHSSNNNSNQELPSTNENTKKRADNRRTTTKNKQKRKKEEVMMIMEWISFLAGFLVASAIWFILFDKVYG